MHLPIYKLNFFFSQNHFHGKQGVNPQNSYDLPQDTSTNQINSDINTINPYSNIDNSQYGGYYHTESQNPNLFPETTARPVNNPQPETIPNNLYQPAQHVTNTENPPYAPPIQYNPFNINYQEVTIDQWQQIPCQHTEYSQYWSPSDVFQPETFLENSHKEKKYHDLCWMIFFFGLIL